MQCAVRVAERTRPHARPVLIAVLHNDATSSFADVRLLDTQRAESVTAFEGRDGGRVLRFYAVA